jgi:hypothetical protein
LADLPKTPRRRGARRIAPPVRHPTLGLLLIFILGLPFLGDFLVAGERAFASFGDGAVPSSSQVEIVQPSGNTPVADGNLTFIEARAVDRIDGVVDRVEVAIDNEDRWYGAQRLAEDPTRWRHLWSDPTPGYHRIRVRAYGVEALPVVEQSAIVDVEDVWSSSYIVDNPYAVPGSFRKGQLHMHSTASFDAWNSLSPAQLALAYKAKGYQFAVMTDHDVISYPREVNDESFVAIPGYESTSDTGHITALFATRTISPNLAPQDRIDGIAAAGGIPILAHPGWRIGWTGTDFARLHGYGAVEIFNGMTSDPQRGAGPNIALWQTVLNAKGWPNRVWGIAVDDAHQPDQMDRGWVMVKTAQLSSDAIKDAMRSGAFYSSNGPSFGALGVMNGAITASSADASVIRFFDQESNLLLETPAAWGAYRPAGKERWVRVEAVMADGRTAWSQPFWLIPNAPRVSLVQAPTGTALAGQTLPGARVHLSDRGQYLGSVVANDEGAFSYSSGSLAEGEHDLWIMATAPWPDQVEGPPTLLSWGATGGTPLMETLGRWIVGTTLGTTRGTAREASSPRS